MVFWGAACLFQQMPGWETTNTINVGSFSGALKRARELWNLSTPPQAMCKPARWNNQMEEPKYPSDDSFPAYVRLPNQKKEMLGQSNEPEDWLIDLTMDRQIGCISWLYIAGIWCKGTNQHRQEEDSHRPSANRLWISYYLSRLWSLSELWEFRSNCPQFANCFFWIRWSIRIFCD